MPRSRAGKGVLFGVILLLTLALLARDDAALLPQAWAPTFFAVKGLAGIVAVLAMLAHIWQAWDHIGSTAQRMRYLLLLAFVVVVASASTAQRSAGLPVTGRNVAALALALLTIPVALISIRQDRRR